MTVTSDERNAERTTRSGCRGSDGTEGMNYWSFFPTGEAVRGEDERNT
jgi:hypothetical protein